MGNTLRTTLLLAVLTVFLVWIGKLLGGSQGMIIAFVLAMAMNAFSYWFSDKIVLRMYRAREVTMSEAPDLYAIVRNLATNAGLPMPRVYIIPNDSPNAFATGRNPDHAVVAVTEGLLRLMSREELTGVLAHELAHVRNRDILIGSVAATLAGAVMILANMARWAAIFGGGSRDNKEGGSGGLGLIVMSILAPVGAFLIQTAISRSREYQADATGSKFAGHPEGLASALNKLGQYSKQLPMEASPSTAHMFIVNPLNGRGMMSLFSTHPPLEDRIARLLGRRTPGSISSDRSTSPSKERAADDFWTRLSS
ncbi:MAG: zinc metalloprotease HtpX [Deltaproteobacteria bacterium]|nr:zinc metalloprotease HtpX [Deltaproteobacteria bacterium]